MSSQEFPKTLAGFGYAFNHAGELRKVDPETGVVTDKRFEFNISEDAAKNQQHYEALGDVLNDHVYGLLVEEGLHKIYVPSDLPEDEATFVFASKENLRNSEKVLVLIHGSGVVRAGQWARSLIINQSIHHGTQIPYIRKAIALGYDVLVANTNDNQRKGLSIPGNDSPNSHASHIWEKFFAGNDAIQHVAIVAHSYGGVVTSHLAKKYTEDFKKKVFAVGLTDSVHMHMSGHIGELLKKVARNYVTSRKPLNTLIASGESDIPMYSAGHEKHEWTSWACQEPLFEFLEDKLRKINDPSPATKKSKTDL